MVILRYSENVKFAIIAGITLICLNFWSFKVIGESKYKLLDAIVYVVLLAIVVYNSRVFTSKNLRFKAVTLLFIFVPMLSIISANIFHNQAPGLTLLMLRANIIWLLYFVLHI